MLGDMYDLDTCKFGPEMLGWWCNRIRRFCVLHLKPEHGGIVKPTQSLSNMFAFFSQPRPQGGGAKGSMFCCSAPSVVESVLATERDRISKCHDNDLLLGSMHARRVLYMKDFLHDKESLAWESLNVEEHILSNMFTETLTKREGDAVVDLIKRRQCSVYPSKCLAYLAMV